MTIHPDNSRRKTQLLRGALIVSAGLLFAVVLGAISILPFI